MAHAGISTTLVEKNRSPSPPSQLQVRTVGIGEYREVSECLAQAFAQDEVARYFFDTDDMEGYSEAYKWKLHSDILRYIVAAHCYNGIVTTVGENYGAVALWMPPGKNMDGWWTILRSGLWRLYYRLSREGRARFYSEFLPLLHDTKQEVLGARDDNSLYLVYIGTKPEARRKGYAQLLITHGTRMADAAGLPTYLESSAKINESYYAKLGFELKGHVSLQRGEKPVEMGIMVREPRIPKKLTVGSSAGRSGV